MMLGWFFELVELLENRGLGVVGRLFISTRNLPA
jgi:hypothetical protein